MLVFVERDGFTAEQLERIWHRLVRQAVQFSALFDDHVDTVAIQREFKQVFARGNLDRPARPEVIAYQRLQFSEFPMVVQNVEAHIRQPAQLGLFFP